MVNTFTVPISGLPNGLYIAKVYTKTGVYLQKVVIE